MSPVPCYRKYSAGAGFLCGTPRASVGAASKILKLCALKIKSDKKEWKSEKVKTWKSENAKSEEKKNTWLNIKSDKRVKKWKRKSENMKKWRKKKKHVVNERWIFGIWAWLEGAGGGGGKHCTTSSAWLWTKFKICPAGSSTLLGFARAMTNDMTARDCVSFCYRIECIYRFDIQH